jgi:hypothetical protein
MVFNPILPVEFTNPVVVIGQGKTGLNPVWKEEA